jgi:energy-coupling factor transport system ATP-binding protein
VLLPDSGPAPGAGDAALADASGGAALIDASGGAALIDLRGVSYTYEGERAPILQEVSLRVDEGEFVLLLGPSGCGKSTLLYILNGIIPHSLRGKLEGEARCCGLDVAQTKIAVFSTQVGMVFQDPEAQLINTRVRDEVCFGLENLRRAPAEILERQAEALAIVGLGHAGDASVWNLSGGQKQRVSIAAVLAARPRLLVLDEPTANLDPAGMAEVFAVLHRLNQEFGTTIVLVEHRVDELASLVSRVVMMERGRITFDGAPRQAFASRATAVAGSVSASAWFPQVSEFGLDLLAACGRPVVPDRLPLTVEEACAQVDDVLHHAPEVAPEITIAPLPSLGSEVPEPLLVVDRLRYAYADGVPILDDVSFTLPPARIVALLGCNGSGKTTLARTLMGINPPPRGAIKLAGRDLAQLSTRELASEIGYVFQNPDHQFVTDRVDDEVAYGLRVRGWAEGDVTARVDEVLEIVDLRRYRARSPFSLSLGERRRLSVATMLAFDPRLLILDEPTIGQDHERAQQLMGLMARLRDRFGSTVLMITHDMRLVADWADRALVLSAGQVRFDGALDQLFAQENLLREAGLLPPPVHALSAALTRRYPGRVPRATLSAAELIGWLAAGYAPAAPLPLAAR